MTTPDPEIVREIARDCVADYINDARDIAAHVMGHFGMGVPGDVYAWTDAVRTDLRAVVPSWPDEQPQDDGDVRAVRALTNAASRMLGMWAEADEAVRRELWTTLHDRADDVFDRYRERYAELDAKAGES